MVLLSLEIVGGYAARKGCVKAMAVPEHEQARHDEELLRLQIREELACKRTPQRIILAVLWAIAFLVLAFASPRVHF